MENLLVVIIFVVSVIYKIYSNFKKEAEKAKNRNPQQRPISTYPIEPIEVHVPPVYTNEIKENYTSSKDSTPEEVQRIIDFKKQLKNNTEISTDENQSKQDQPTFDLQQAILHQVILERPYK